MSEAYDNATRHTWEFAADWREDDTQHVRFGIVRARNMDEAEQFAKIQSHPSAKVSVKFSGWNRDA